MTEDRKADPTIAKRMARMREKQAQKGWKRVEVIVPPEGEEDIRRLAQRLREGKEDRE